MLGARRRIGTLHVLDEPINIYIYLMNAEIKRAVKCCLWVTSPSFILIYTVAWMIECKCGPIEWCHVKVLEGYLDFDDGEKQGIRREMGDVRGGELKLKIRRIIDRHE